MPAWVTSGWKLTAELHEVPRGVLVAHVETIAEIEGPVHVDEVVTRIREAWGLKRAGTRIRDAVISAIDVAARKGSIERQGEFVSIPERQPVLRNRATAMSAGIRKPEMIPLSEIAAGAVEIVRVNFGATQDQLVSGVSRALGFKSTSEGLRTRIMAGIAVAMKDQKLFEASGLLQISPDAP